MSEALRTLVPIKAILLIVQFLLFLIIYFTRVSKLYNSLSLSLSLFSERICTAWPAKENTIRIGAIPYSFKSDGGPLSPFHVLRTHWVLHVCCWLLSDVPENHCVSAPNPLPRRCVHGPVHRCAFQSQSGYTDHHLLRRITSFHGVLHRIWINL